MPVPSAFRHGLTSSKVLQLSRYFITLSMFVLAGCGPLHHYEFANYGPTDASAGDVTHAHDQGAKVVTPKHKSVAVLPQKCDDTLWHHVYNPERLIVHQMCLEVTGTIVDATHGKRKDGVRHEADGDCHGWLKLDPGQEKLLNAGNMSDEGGNLVFEVVCLFPVTQKDAVSACKGYKSTIKLPAVGSHVRMAGSWVQDTNHAKWNEIHPVSSIEVVKD